MDSREEKDFDIESLVVEKSSEEGEDGGDRVAVVEKFVAEEKHKKNTRKPSKPPRPPKGPSILDAADEKWVRELAELALRKRARVERMKALKKMKPSKASFLNSGVSALLITLIFLFVIAFQGLGSRSSANMRLHGSPEIAVMAGESLISVQQYKDSFAYESHGSGSGSLSFVEDRASGSGPGEDSVKLQGDTKSGKT